MAYFASNFDSLIKQDALDMDASMKVLRVLEVEHNRLAVSPSSQNRSTRKTNVHQGEQNARTRQAG
jgi:hypothetical protein